MLLAIETATDVCSVALMDNGSVTALAEVLRPRAHATQLAPLVRDLLEREGVRASDLDAVAVSAGPGSYTGLRIGVSTAKGLCFGSGAALIAVPSLEALAWSVADLVVDGDLIVAAFRSRRSEVYAAAFTRGEGGITVAAPATALTHGEIEEWLPTSSGEFWLVGEAGRTIGELVDRPHRLLDPARHRPGAAHVATLGWQLWKAGTVADLAAFEPLYLKPFEVRRASSIFERLPH